MEIRRGNIINPSSNTECYCKPALGVGILALQDYGTVDGHRRQVKVKYAGKSKARCTQQITRQSFVFRAEGYYDWGHL
jgi:hypothetical protein